jgi:hypothetical protein
MTSFAMTAGMVPMALALGEGGEQTAPLGRAVIGGLVAATLATLLVLPLVFVIVQGRSSIASASLYPNDPNSRYYVAPTEPARVVEIRTNGQASRATITEQPVRGVEPCAGST